MKLGLDFDNTIVCYDRAFHAAAQERGWLEGEVTVSKDAVKAHLHERQRNDDWTELQGYVYGPGIVEAEPFPGLTDFLAAANERNWKVWVVSHKTRHPYRGPQYDLHEAARSWIESSGLLDDSTGLHRDRLFFETTKEAKLQRVGSLEVDAFIDDLPEILAHPAFPDGVAPILFDPKAIHTSQPYRKLSEWSQASAMLVKLSQQ